MDAATEEQVTRALGRVTVWAPDVSPDARFGPLADLDPPAYVAAICRRLGGAPSRVGQSALMIGIASRLWSMTVVPAARDGVLPDPAGFVVREDDGAIVLGLAAATGWTGAAAPDVRDVVLSVLEPLVAAIPLADRLLWGNVAASLNAVPQVHEVPMARALADDLLALAPLAGELETQPDGTARRRTCCLFYEVPGAGLCGDCVLDHPPGTR